MDATPFSLEYLSSQLERRSYPKQMKERIERIFEVLGQSKVDLAELRKACELGIPDDIKGTDGCQIRSQGALLEAAGRLSPSREGEVDERGPEPARDVPIVLPGLPEGQVSGPDNTGCPPTKCFSWSRWRTTSH